jgi:cytochrome c5
VNVQDKHFINNFMLVLGFLAATAVVAFIVANMVASGTYSTAQTDRIKHHLLTQRMAPVGEVYVGKVPASARTAAAAAGKKKSSKPMSGKAIWQGTCSACHKTGVAGAPPIGDKQEWSKHIAKGLATLKKHAINGYHGPEGVMPAKGGNPGLTDKQVVKAMEYMVSQSGGAKLVKTKGKKILKQAGGK